MNIHSIRIRIITLTILIAILVSPLGFIPNKKAQALAVPNTCALFDFYCIMDNWKEFVGNRLAVLINNQIIQRMTASIVNWINTGFQGSPAFLTNPEGFFLDVADQITGELIDKTGALSQLCSPFSFDIRLNIALNQSSSYNKRYECTLSRVIGNTQNAIATAGQNSGINLYGDADGATLGNFINGDFSQGGWEGFLAYTIEPQNNPIGAYLLANSDLQSRIAEKQDSVNSDLNRGQGFLSWPKCTDVTSGYLSATEDELGPKFGLNTSDIRNLQQTGTGATGYTALGKGTSIKKTVDKDNKVKYESCEVQTPGSVIASTLFNQADTGREKLVSVKTISDSIDAITGALVNQMLTQGLAALSNRGSGVGGNSQSYLTQLYDESYNQNSFEVVSARDRSLSTSNSVITIAENNITAYNRSLALLNDTKNRYLTASVCFVNKINQLQNFDTVRRSYGEKMTQGISLVITRNIDPLIASTTEKKISTQNQLNMYKNSTSGTTNSYIPGLTGSDITAGFSRLEMAVNNTTQTTQSVLEDSNNIEQRSQSIEETVKDLNRDAQIFQNRCNQFPNLIIQPETFKNNLLSSY